MRVAILGGAVRLVPAEAFDVGGVLLVLGVEDDEEVVALEDDVG